MKPENNIDSLAPFIGPMNMDPTVHAYKPIIHSHDLYLVGEIGDAKNYISWFELIRNARPNDMITIHINSPGGNLYTTLQILRVMKESRASITCSIEGACMSAATMMTIRLLLTVRAQSKSHRLPSKTFGLKKLVCLFTKTS